MPFDREQMKSTLDALAKNGVFLGTSSWKYPGWRGMLYDDARYIFRGKFSEARFERLCLNEYSEVFKTVSVDAAYYRFPEHRTLEDLVAQVPGDFLFTFKVTDEITVKHFSNLPRFGRRAGAPNENFLNADLFASDFLAPCAPFQRNIGLLMFEFSRFYPGDFAHARDFVARLDNFLAKLPQGWPYGVEIRNRQFLQPDYFAALARHGVSHIYTSWDDMPALGEQLAIPESRTRADLVGARLLLAPGRKYEEAVKLFSPYTHLKERNDEARTAAAKLIKQVTGTGGRTKALIYLNNRFEGNALESIEGIVNRAGMYSA